MLQLHSRALPTDLQTRGIPAADERLSPRDVISFWRRYAALICTYVFVGLALGEAYILVTPSNYVAASQILIESRRALGQSGADVSFAQFSLDTSQIENQIQFIKSEQISRQVVQGLSLDQTVEVARSSILPLSALRNLIFHDVEPAIRDPRQVAIRTLADRLQVRRIGQSYVIEISYWSLDAETAARICNSVTAAYFSDLLRAKIDMARGGNEVLERRVNALREQLAAADLAVKRGMFDPDVLSTTEARVITAASSPTSRSWPQGSLILAFSALLGLFLALLTAAIQRSLDTAIRTRGQVERELGLETLAILPRLPLRMRRHIVREAAQDRDSAFAKAIRQMKVSLQLQQAGASLSCIGITSTTRREGRATVAINLAYALCAAGTRTLLIDADPQGGHLTRMLACANEVGILELLGATSTLTQAVIPGELGQPDFIPLGQARSKIRSEDLLGSDLMGEILAASRKYYGTVLVLLSPLEESPDARAIAPHLDGIVLVAAYGHLPAYRIGNCVSSLEASNVKILGLVVNKSRNSLAV